METIKGRQIRSQRRHKDQMNEHFYFILRSGVGVAVSLKAFHCQIEQGYSPKIVLFKSHFKFLLVQTHKIKFRNLANNGICINN